MNKGQLFQIVSLVLLCIAGICGVFGTIFGYIGNQISDKGYWETIKSLTRHVDAAKTRQKPTWTPFIKVNADAAFPETAKTAKVQYQLWVDDNTIPLMMKICPDKDCKFVSEVAGPSGVVEIPVIEKQTFYVSFSDPRIRYTVGIVGWEY